MTTKYFFWIFIFVINLLRLRAASQFGLTVDEAHYVLYGQFLDWSYFDHPPLIGWTHWVFHLLPVDQLIRARIPAILITLLTSKLIFNYLISKNISEKNSLLAISALQLTPMFNTLSIVLLPDSFLMPLTILILTITEKIKHHSNLKNWSLLGLYLGLAGLSKYTAILFVFSLILIFIFNKQFKELLKPNFWVGVFIALALISPVLYWNIKNNWISFQYQAEHVLSLDASLLQNLGGSAIIQLISWGVTPFLFSITAFFLILKDIRKENIFFECFLFLSVFLLFFTYAATSEVLLPHWMTIYFVIMIPIAYSYFLQNHHSLKWIILGTSISAFISLALLFEISFKLFPTKTTANFYEGVIGWDQLLAEANNKLKALPPAKKALAVMNWTLGSRAMYYNKQNTELFVIDKRFDQFDIWSPQHNIGYDLLLIIEANKKDENLGHINCVQLTEVGEFKTFLKEVPVNHFLYYHCANFLGYK